MVDEIEAGNLRGLFVSGGSPLTAFPDPARTEAALRSLDLLVVVDVVENVNTEIASHVLAVAGQLERSDISGRGRTMYAPAVVPPGADRKPAWWVYGELGCRLGLDLLNGLEPNDCTEESLLRAFASQSRGGADALFAAGPRGLPSPLLYGWVHERALPDGQWRLAPDVLIDRLPSLLDDDRKDGLVLVSRREAANTNYVRYAASQVDYEPAILLHSADAAAIGVADGSRVIVASDAGEVETVVGIDDRYRVGVVSMTHGWTHRNVDRLVDRVNEIDPLTGQPVMTGIPVTITPLP
jgi:anaerobic selenocysteine-containing dehydrogenase